MERVERVEELFLRLRLGREELDVVHEEKIALVAVARPELVHPLVFERLDELVDELLGGHIDDPRLRALGTHAVRDGMDQVSLAKARAAANEQRIVAPSAASCSGDRGRVSELIRRADDEVPEGILRVQTFEGSGRHRDRAA
jgi:hypothetical protein